MKIKLFTIPNIITCLNLIAGCFAIDAAMSGDLFWAMNYILIAAVFDFFDGFAARMLKSYSDVGKELDSLADMVSFGVAPSFILFSVASDNVLGYGVFVVAAFSALRLAKFNIDTRQSTEFIGLPTPANAILISSAVYIASTVSGTLFGDLFASIWFILGFAVVMSILLVSEIPMFSFKFKSFGWADNKLRYIFVLFTVITVTSLKLAALPIVILAYIAVSVVRSLVKR